MQSQTWLFSFNGINCFFSSFKCSSFLTSLICLYDSFFGPQHNTHFQQINSLSITDYGPARQNNIDFTITNSLQFGSAIHGSGDDEGGDNDGGDLLCIGDDDRGDLLGSGDDVTVTLMAVNDGRFLLGSPGDDVLGMIAFAAGSNLGRGDTFSSVLG